MSTRLNHAALRLGRWAVQRGSRVGAGGQPWTGTPLVEVERWHVQGHLETSDTGPVQEFAFGLSVARVADGPTGRLQGWRAQFSLAEGRAADPASEERWAVSGSSGRTASASTLRARFGRGPTLERADEWRVLGDAGCWSMRARLASGVGVDLDLDLPRTPAPVSVSSVLSSAMERGGQAAWSAETRLTVEGTAFDGECLRRVAGLAWREHRRGPAGQSTRGEQTLRAHLDSGHDLFVRWAPNADGTPAPALGFLTAPDRSVQPLAQASVEKRPHPRSVGSGASQAGIRLVANELTLDVAVGATTPATQRSTGLPASRVHWRGHCRVAGRLRGSPVWGQATVEFAESE